MDFLNLGGLRSRLILLVLIAVLPGFGLALMSRVRERDLHEARFREQALRVAQQAVLKQDELVAETRTLLEQVSKQPELSGAQCETFLDNILKKSSQYIVLATVAANGNSSCSAPATQRPIDVRDRAWFQRTLRDRGFAAGEYQVGRISSQPGLAFSNP
jgi:hypothetical protein